MQAKLAGEGQESDTSSSGMLLNVTGGSLRGLSLCGSTMANSALHFCTRASLSSSSLEDKARESRESDGAIPRSLLRVLLNDLSKHDFIDVHEQSKGSESHRTNSLVPMTAGHIVKRWEDDRKHDLRTISTSE